MTLALIAGTGGVPPHLVRCLLARGEVPLICEPDPFTSEISGELPRLGFRFEQVGSFLSELRNRGITRLCIAGEIRRVPVDPARMDAATLAYLPRLQAGLAQGDDGMMRAVIGMIEDQGIAVIGAAQLAPDLLPGAGLMTGTLREASAAEAAVAVAALKRSRLENTGGAVVVRAGRVVAQADARDSATLLDDFEHPEAQAGWTLDPFDIADQMIGGAADWLSGQDSAAETGGLLYIAPMAGQGTGINMPTIDPDLARRVAGARLDGVVIEAGGVMVLAADELRDAFSARGLFLWVRGSGQP